MVVISDVQPLTRRIVIAGLGRDAPTVDGVRPKVHTDDVIVRAVNHSDLGAARVIEESLDIWNPARRQVGQTPAAGRHEGISVKLVLQFTSSTHIPIVLVVKPGELTWRHVS
jgi:hypothetical protein